MIEALNNKEKVISVTGLGYVGLPLALTMARRYRVIGFDSDEERVRKMRQDIDPSRELTKEDFEGCDIHFTSDDKELSQAHFHIIAVPTPVDAHKVPDLAPVIRASRSVGNALKPGDVVVYESTVYPGCTEEDCLPILEVTSSLRVGTDFKLGYSPERINPGDQTHSVEKITKVVSGNDEEAVELISKVYGNVIDAGIFKAVSIKVAEAAKVIENTQRDLNISFVNELSIIFDKLGIDTHDVLETAATKWNFLNFYPGLVGGHCIGVDPYYLLHKAKQVGYHPQVILSGRRINDGMPAFVSKKLVQMLIQQNKSPQDCRVLVMGMTFKENVFDIRNSKVAELIKELEGYRISVDALDPHASPEEVKAEYDLSMVAEPKGLYDAIIIAVSHKVFREMAIDQVTQHLKDKAILMDVKGIFRDQVSGLNGLKYWSL